MASNPPTDRTPVQTAKSVSTINALFAATTATRPEQAAHPLEAVEEVESAMPIIAALLNEERKGLPRRVYPRTVLRHQHIIAYMLTNPFAETTEICAFFGIAPTTLNNISKSDTFKALLNQHRLSLDSYLGQDLQEQLRQTLSVAIEVTQRAVVTQQDPDYALAVLDKTANRLGMGVKHQATANVQVNVVTPEMIAAAHASRLRRLPP